MKMKIDLYQTLGHIAKAMLMGNFVAVNARTRKEENSIRAKINDIETKKKIEKNQ